MIKFGKPIADVLSHKISFFTDNDARLSDCKRLFEAYLAQPKRVKCKNCCYFLGDVTFKKLGVGYIICEQCGHLNGAHEDTDDFCSLVYTKDAGKAYAVTYDAETVEIYNKRVEDIYLPKAEFLTAALQEQRENPGSLRYAELGAGSGYFIAALKKAGLFNVLGFEVSESQVELANAMLGEKLLRRHELTETIELAAGVKADVVSLIGVLEHLQRPRDLLKELKENSNVRYIFLSLPLFSPCVFSEMVFDKVMPRQLAPAHTHLYTESSIDYFCNEFCFERVAEWWFGTDMLDLFRNIWVKLKQSSDYSNAVSVWENMFKPLVDDMQLAQDKRRMASEVHMLLKIKKK